MLTLVLYHSRIPLEYDRLTIKESVECFGKYLPGKTLQYNYVNGLPKFLNKLNFDLVIIHYSLLAIKFSEPQKLISFGEKLKNLSGYKVAFPQDEYINSSFLNLFLKTTNVKQLYTLFIDKNDINKVYPVNETGITKIFNVLPGYVNNDNLKSEEQLKPFNKRIIDLGYRARKNPFWLGEFSLRKWEIANFFNGLKNHGFNFDISTKIEDTIVGESWYEFIENCKYFIAVEGGASLLDKKGETREKVEEYLRINPNSSFKKVSSTFFFNENKIKYFQLTPRIFEAISRKTCLILMEGDYNGLLIPNEHYILLKKDYSNVNEVLNKMKDEILAKKIVENAYRDFILSNKYSYESFVNFVFSQVKNEISYNSKNSELIFIWFNLFSVLIDIKIWFILILRKLKKLFIS